jgi:hypothetical protein
LFFWFCWSWSLRWTGLSFLEEDKSFFVVLRIEHRTSCSSYHLRYGTSLFVYILFWDKVSLTFFSLAWNSRSSCLCLLISWNYRYEPLCLAHT